jgi:hypothetical protein
LAPSRYCISPDFKEHLEGRQYSSIEEATLAVDEGWFAAQSKGFFLEELKKLEQQSHKRVELKGNV